MRSDLSTLKLVRIGQPLRRGAVQEVVERVRGAFGAAIQTFRILDYTLPAFEQIDAALLTQALEQDVGGHILGITDADLLDHSGEDFFDFVFGCKDNRNHVAVVSTRRIAGGAEGLSLARLIKVALHELGHNFGLVHHYAFARTDRGGYCPMTKGDYNRHGERSYVRSVIDARGFHFCQTCRRFLRVAGAS